MTILIKQRGLYVPYCMTRPTEQERLRQAEEIARQLKIQDEDAKVRRHNAIIEELEKNAFKVAIGVRLRHDNRKKDIQEMTDWCEENLTDAEIYVDDKQTDKGRGISFSDNSLADSEKAKLLWVANFYFMEETDAVAFGIMWK